MVRSVLKSVDLFWEKFLGFEQFGKVSNNFYFGVPGGVSNLIFAKGAKNIATALVV